MMPIEGVYEIAVRVEDLARAERFYCDVLGLEVGLRDEKRGWLFLRAGGLSGMIVLQEEAGPIPPQHFAFAISPENIDLACWQLSNSGVTYEGPVVHGWMPATSVYFRDPDGHDLELCATR
jgi:lactoylglutathione lyase